MTETQNTAYRTQKDHTLDEGKTNGHRQNTKYAKAGTHWAFVPLWVTSSPRSLLHHQKRERADTERHPRGLFAPSSQVSPFLLGRLPAISLGLSLPALPLPAFAFCCVVLSLFFSPCLAFNFAQTCLLLLDFWLCRDSASSLFERFSPRHRQSPQFLFTSSTRHLRHICPPPTAHGLHPMTSPTCNTRRL